MVEGITPLSWSYIKESPMGGGGKERERMREGLVSGHDIVVFLFCEPKKEKNI